MIVEKCERARHEHARSAAGTLPLLVAHSGRWAPHPWRFVVMILETNMSIPAAIFKAECLKLVDEVARIGRPLVITMHGRPVASLGPVPPDAESLFGYMHNTVTFRDDIVAPTVEAWSALEGDEDRLVSVVLRKPRPKRGRAKK